MQAEGKVETETITQQAADIEAAGWTRRRAGPFMQAIGPLWARRAEQNWQYGLLAGEQHLNPAGVVHGGLLQALIDHALSALAWDAAGRAPCVTLQADTQFLAPVRAGDFIVAQGSVMQRTRGLVFMHGQLAVTGQPVLNSQAIFKIAKHAARRQDSPEANGSRTRQHPDFGSINCISTNIEPNPQKQSERARP